MTAGFTFSDIPLAEDALPADVVRYFHRILLSSETVAAHCKTGLTRAALMIATHLVKNEGFSAGEAIAWVRLCRPGSIIGAEQSLLAKYDQAVNLRERMPAHERGPSGLARSPRAPGSGHGKRRLRTEPVPLEIQGAMIEPSHRGRL
jgi:hypothetical protein